MIDYPLIWIYNLKRFSISVLPQLIQNELLSYSFYFTLLLLVS